MGIDLRNSGVTGTGFRFLADNYADLLTVVGMVEGDLANVYNSQGVWLINRKLKGVYMYQLGVWEYANQEIQNRLGDKIDTIVPGTNIIVDNTDPQNPIVSLKPTNDKQKVKVLAVNTSSNVFVDIPGASLTTKDFGQDANYSYSFNSLFSHSQNNRDIFIRFLINGVPTSERQFDSSGGSNEPFTFVLCGQIPNVSPNSIIKTQWRVDSGTATGVEVSFHFDGVPNDTLK